MRQDSIFETLLSAAVVVVAAGFLFYTYQITGGVWLSDYDVTASMTNASGLEAGASDVLLAGTKIGTVADLTLDPKSYRARVRLRLRDDVRIPDDSTLSLSSGLMSSQASLSVTPGRSATMLAPGGMLKAK